MRNSWRSKKQQRQLLQITRPQPGPGQTGPERTIPKAKAEKGNPLGTKSEELQKQLPWDTVSMMLTIKVWLTTINPHRVGHQIPQKWEERIATRALSQDR